MRPWRNSMVASEVVKCVFPVFVGINGHAFDWLDFRLKQYTPWLGMSRSRRTTPDQRLALLRQQLKQRSPNMMTADLRSALCDQANFVVEQVANVVRENTLRELIPELVSAYHRFLNDGAVASCRHCSSICLRSGTRQRGYWRCLVPSCPIHPAKWSRT